MTKTDVRSNHRSQSSGADALRGTCGRISRFRPDGASIITQTDHAASRLRQADHPVERGGERAQTSGTGVIPQSPAK